MGMIDVLLALYIYYMYKCAVTLGWVPEVALLRRLGFRTTGVASGTVASWLQSRYGGVVPTRGWFATLQKYGRNGGIPTMQKRAWQMLGLLLLYQHDVL